MAKPLKILSLGQPPSSQCGLLHVANSSIDGGGIRGISSLLLLESIMEKVRETEKLDHDIKPSQYFDLIGGTSTGGIIAIMLGRLDMTVRECINAYKSVAEAAFTRRPRLPLPAPPKGEYSATALVEAFKSVIRKYCQDPQCVAQREGSSSTTTTCPHGDKIFQDEMCCETVVLAITKGNVDGPPTLFKTYDKATRFRDCTVWQVARATSAATTFFESIQCGLDEIDFIDAGFGYNNPCEVLIEEAKRRHPDNAELHILSIGTGLGKVVTIKDSRRSILDALKTMSSSSSKVARSLETKYRGSDTYFRFNVEKGLEDITLSDWHETSKISSHTHNYLLEEDWKIEKYARVTSRVMELASGPLPGDRITITQEVCSYSP
ncbi:phosphorylase superfamily protein [Fusarium oxysporum f. sp. phaseoli]